jgi:hypothetical protein
VKTNVYVDGFNLYFGCFKNPRHPNDRRYRWLDIAAFCQAALPHDQINRIRYFTARLTGTPLDPDLPVRQQAYLRALNTIPNLTIHHGHFLSTRKTGLLVGPTGPGTSLATVEVWEEKGSDVNLATHLLVDAFDQDYELAVIISNDSDLVGPIRVIREKFGLRVGVLNPQSNVSHALRLATHFYREVPRVMLDRSQFRDPMTDARGIFRKPKGW